MCLCQVSHCILLSSGASRVRGGQGGREAGGQRAAAGEGGAHVCGAVPPAHRRRPRPAGRHHAAPRRPPGLEAAVRGPLQRVRRCSFLQMLCRFYAELPRQSSLSTTLLAPHMCKGVLQGGVLIFRGPCRDVYVI
jgi:hypothetical protein